MIFRFAMQTTGSKDLAEDITQDAFYAPDQKTRVTFDPDRGNFSSFECGIARIFSLRFYVC